VVQGSRLGPVLFDLFLDDLLVSLSESGFGPTLAGTKVPVLAFADDLCLMATSPGELQRLLDIVFSWATKNTMEFHPGKSKVLVFHQAALPKEKAQRLSFLLGGAPLEILSEYKYLGIRVSNKGGVSYKLFFEEMLSKAALSLARVIQYGFASDGLRPLTAVRLFKSIVRPVLEFGAQFASFSKTQMCKLENFQYTALRTLFGLSRSVSRPMVRTFAGIQSLRSRYKILKLNYFERICSLPSNSIIRRIGAQRISQPNEPATSQSFFGRIRSILVEVDALDVFHLDLPPESNALQAVRASVSRAARVKDQAAVSSSPQSRFFKDLFCAGPDSLYFASQ